MHRKSHSLTLKLLFRDSNSRMFFCTYTVSHLLAHVPRTRFSRWSQFHFRAEMRPLLLLDSHLFIHIRMWNLTNCTPPFPLPSIRITNYVAVFSWMISISLQMNRISCCCCWRFHDDDDNISLRKYSGGMSSQEDATISSNDEARKRCCSLFAINTLLIGFARCAWVCNRWDPRVY